MLLKQSTAYIKTSSKTHAVVYSMSSVTYVKSVNNVTGNDKRLSPFVAVGLCSASSGLAACALNVSLTKQIDSKCNSS